MPTPTRREFLTTGSIAGFGFLGFPLSTTAAVTPWRREARADAVIQIHVAGGMTHLDTFDPKPDAPTDVRGPWGAIDSKIDAEPVGALMRRTAAISDKITIVRSVSHPEAAHSRGTHTVLTGYQPSPAIVFPSFGAVAAHELGSRSELPPYICVPSANSPYLGTGYLEAAHGPFAVGGNPAQSSFRVRDLNPPKGVDEARRERRRQLLHDLDAGCPDLQDAQAVAASEAFYQQANTLIESEPARAAFDLSKESNAMKERYGRSGIGMSCLLARRLVAGGARYVVATSSGWDHHNNIQSALPPRVSQLDRAFAALIADLDAQGMLDRTLVLLTTEFGRTPRINSNGGRDHWSRVFSVALAGGGFARGLAYGRSNATGAQVESDPVSPADLAATVFSQLGIEPHKRLMAPGDRPIDLVRNGRVLDEVLM